VIQGSQVTHMRTPSATDLHSRSVKGNGPSQSELMREREGGLSEKETNALAVVVAEMKGEVLNELGNQRHDIKNITHKLDSLQTKREAELIQKETNRRLESLENDRRRAVWHILSIWSAGLVTAGATAWAFAKKVF
jgi:hypothetical protein